ncbi:MAG TPA: TetR family transcriptional regulator C-terminal domain-containing protein [Actinocrinis sp.]|jgi:TetR/AcrR family transcriptional repressor of nem operon|uniref:TetR/AcrR family transcriptional regulator n=1 Tax=Actinocrinis sp. TaxID=1920516 RepID=UPI002DDCB9F9|nr:TetR family transcriptional regulator C-terminal domain-containing protein [Actinocrinis sp.]HEV3172916.1 TetR family transcriptional regulator C-terminal domain-containing protein [Actinocrinis sp.]
MVRESKREEIVAAALDRFHADGYNATGVKDITDAAGVPKGSFYNHFESKESLATLVLERYGETRRLDELADTSVDPLDRLRNHFTFARRENESRDFTRGCMFGNFGAEIVDHSDEIRESVRQSFDAWAQALASTIAEARDAGTVRADIDPDKTARFLLSAWEGTLITARVYRSTDAFDTFFDIALGSLLKP